SGARYGGGAPVRRDPSGAEDWGGGVHRGRSSDRGASGGRPRGEVGGGGGGAGGASGARGAGGAGGASGSGGRGGRTRTTGTGGGVGAQGEGEGDRSWRISRTRRR